MEQLVQVCLLLCPVESCSRNCKFSCSLQHMVSDRRQPVIRLDIECAVIKTFFSCGPEQGRRIIRVRSAREQALQLQPLQSITWITPLGTCLPDMPSEWIYHKPPNVALLKLLKPPLSSMLPSASTLGICCSLSSYPASGKICLPSYTLFSFPCLFCSNCCCPHERPMPFHLTCLHPTFLCLLCTQVE